jgi:eukaryotic-like serine/threonine-protein kinase
VVPLHPSVIAGRYRIDALVGGTASRVHRAHDLLLQRDVAIKSFPGDDGPLRWRRDGRLRERLGAGQAMEVLDGDPDGHAGPFVVMPLARDGSLDRSAAAWEPWPAAVLVARLAVGLRRLHGLGAVHGAVAADAVLLDPQHGPRWTGHGGVPPEGATAEDDVIAFARVATAAVTGLPAGGEVSDELVDAVRALARGPADVAGIERVRAGLAAEVARLGPRPSTLPVEVPVLAADRAGRLRRTVLAACTAAAVAGAVVGVGAGAVGDDGATAAAADVAGAAPILAAPVTGGDAAPPSTEARAAVGSATRDRAEPAPAAASARAVARTADSDASPAAPAPSAPRSARGDGDGRGGRLAERGTTGPTEDADQARDDGRGRGDDGRGRGDDEREGGRGGVGGEADEDAGRGADEGRGVDAGGGADEDSGDGGSGGGSDATGGSSNGSDGAASA